MSFIARNVPTATRSGARAFSTTPMRPLSKIQLIGRLADQPEAIATSTGRELVRYSLGVNNGPKNENGQRGTSWFKVASFAEGPQRDFLLSLSKGTQVYVEGDARIETFQNQNGETVTRLNITQRSLEALSRPRSVQDGQQQGDETNAVESPNSGIGQS